MIFGFFNIWYITNFTSIVNSINQKLLLVIKQQTINKRLDNKSDFSYNHIICYLFYNTMISLDHPRIGEIQSILQRFDLNETQQTVYLTWLVLGPATVIQIADHAKLGRLAVHQASKQLIDLWLMMETWQGKRRLIYPHSIDWLIALLEERKFALRQLEQQLEAAKDIFSYLKQASNTFPMTRLYQGIEWINTTIIEMANDRQPISIIYDATALHSIVDEKLFHRSYQQRAKYHSTTRLILPDQFTDFRHLKRKEDYDVRIKTLLPDQLIQWGIEIRWSKVALHSYNQPFVTTTIIDNAQIAQIIQVMYESMRNQAHDYQEKYLLI